MRFVSPRPPSERSACTVALYKQYSQMIPSHVHSSSSPMPHASPPLPRWHHNGRSRCALTERETRFSADDLNQGAKKIGLEEKPVSTEVPHNFSASHRGTLLSGTHAVVVKIQTNGFTSNPEVTGLSTFALPDAT